MNSQKENILILFFKTGIEISVRSGKKENFFETSRPFIFIFKNKNANIFIGRIKTFEV